MTTSEVESRNITISMRKSMENLVISSQDAIGQSISQALTFSGVITQHNNTIIHENRSVSRSPSPSLRNADCGPDSLENDKVTEGWLLQSVDSCAAALAGGSDSASVSSGEVVTVVNAPPILKPDNPKAASQNPGPRSIESTGRTKKKSWYNALYPTYKSKSDDFKRLFKDLPDDERLIVDYSCALQKDILAHGRLYASQNYLCFYASFFSWETSLTLRWKDVTAITKEKTALVIPNAILICTEGEKNFLTSFAGRDKAYLMLFRIWQNALMDQPMSSPEILQWVHNWYGEELGFNSDEEGYMRDVPDDVPALPADVLEDPVYSSSVEASGGGDSKEDSKSNRSASHGRDSSPPLENKKNVKPMNGAKKFSDMSSVLDFWRVVDGCEIAIAAAPVTNGDAEDREEEPGDTLPTDMSDTSESEPDKPNHGGEMEKCTEPHDGKLMLKQQFPFNINNLFTMIFTNSKFQLELLAARGTTDYVQAPWQVQNGRKYRQISYRLSLSTGPIGPKEVHVTETQVMNKCSKPGVLYSIEVTSENSGIPYADYISVIAHYCLNRVSDSVTELSLYGSIKYKRSMWPMVKAFIEKNALGGLEEFSRLLETRLAAEADCAAPQARKARRHRRLTSSSGEACPSAGAGSPPPLATPRAPPPRAAAARPAHWLLLALLALLLLNALLYWRLYHADRPFDLDDLHNRMSSVGDSQLSDWSRLLEQHSHRQRGQLRAWRLALDRTVQHLAQTEQALTKLLETIKPSLEGAPPEPQPDRTEL